MNSGVPMTDRAFTQNSTQSNLAPMYEYAEDATGVARRYLLVALSHTRREAAGTPSSHHTIHSSTHTGIRSIGLNSRNHLFVVVVHVRREAEVTDLDVAGVAVHENVVALEIACALLPATSYNASY
jgi:hypothetical protein